MINSGSFDTTQCSLNSQTGFYEVTFSNVAKTTTIVAASTIKLRMKDSFRNPVDTGTISGFTITSYHSDSYKI